MSVQVQPEPILQPNNELEKGKVATATEQAPRLSSIKNQIEETQFDVRTDSKWFASADRRIDELFPMPSILTVQHNTIQLNTDKGHEKQDKTSEAELKSQDVAIGVNGTSSSKAEAKGHLTAAESHLKEAASQLELAKELLEKGNVGEAELIVASARDNERLAKEEIARAEKAIDIARRQIIEESLLASHTELDNRIIHLHSASSDQQVA